jgi:hypothetical protein
MLQTCGTWHFQSPAWFWKWHVLEPCKAWSLDLELLYISYKMSFCISWLVYQNVTLVIKIVLLYFLTCVSKPLVTVFSPGWNQYTRGWRWSRATPATALQTSRLICLLLRHHCKHPVMYYHLSTPCNRLQTARFLPLHSFVYSYNITVNIHTFTINFFVYSLQQNC